MIVTATSIAVIVMFVTTPAHNTNIAITVTRRLMPIIRIVSSDITTDGDVAVASAAVVGKAAPFGLISRIRAALLVVQRALRGYFPFSSLLGGVAVAGTRHLLRANSTTRTIATRGGGQGGRAGGGRAVRASVTITARGGKRGGRVSREGAVGASRSPA